MQGWLKICMLVYTFLLGNCETGLAFDVQRRQTPDFVGDEQEKVDGDIGKAGMEGKQTEKGRTNRRKSRPPI